MNQLPSSRAQPTAISKEAPAKNLASLVKNEALEQLTSTLIHQWEIREAFEEVAKYGIKPIDKALFFGPPGNGKTMAAQMIAKQLGVPLFRVRCETLIQANLGATESNMADVMDWLGSQGACVVLFDECESLFTKRGGHGDSCTKTMDRAMQIFWQSLDRWDSPQLFLLATNLVDQLDDALLSRLELKLEFLPPTMDQALKVIAYWAEQLHPYGADNWGPFLTERIQKGSRPESFRELWQWISSAVRQHIVDLF